MLARLGVRDWLVEPKKTSISALGSQCLVPTAGFASHALSWAKIPLATAMGLNFMGIQEKIAKLCACQAFRVLPPIAASQIKMTLDFKFEIFKSSL